MAILSFRLSRHRAMTCEISTRQSCIATRGLTLACLGLGLFAISCDSTPPQPTTVLGVEYAGCAGARRGPICERPQGPLTLWIPGSPDETVIEIDGRPTVLPASTTIQDGFRLEIEVPAESQSLRIHQAPGAAFSLRLEEPIAPERQGRLEELIAARSFDQAGVLATEILANDPEGPSERGLALATLGRLSLRGGEVAEGRSQLQESIPLLRQAGDLQTSFDVTTVLAFALLARDFDFTQARELLSTLPRDWHAPGEVRYFDAYYQGLLAMATGDARGALDHLEAAVESANRTGTTWFQRAAEELVAVQLLRIGRHAEAESALTALLDRAGAEDDPCREAGVLGNLGLNALLARETGAHDSEPLKWMEAALETLEQSCPRDHSERQNGLLNVAHAELNVGNLEAARRALAKAAEVDAEPGVRLLLWWRELEARLELASGQARKALELFESLRRTADAALAPEARWHARVGSGMARRQLGDLEGALRDFQESEKLLDTELLLIPIQDGRESWLALRRRATAHHLELLLTLGRPNEALTLARRARIRILRHLNLPIRLRGLEAQKRVSWERLVTDYREERAVIDRVAADDWQLAAEALEKIRLERRDAREQLRKTLDTALTLLQNDIRGFGVGSLPALEVTPGAASLIFHPLPKGWVVFSHLHGETRAHAPSCPATDSRDLAACLLNSAGAALQDATEIRILAAGSLATLDFQTLPFKGGILLDLAPIVYELDLGSTDQGGTNDLPASALIVADAIGDLPSARREAESVEKQASSEFPVRLITGRDASSQAVTAALPAVELFHFAGHARFSGRGGWQTYLPLADGGQLTLEDILLMQRPPRWIVLSGCDTARSAEPHTAAQNVGLAQAFLAAGTETVVAAVRPVDDRLAADLIESFYITWLAGEKPAAALRKAQLSLRREQPNTDWSSFRVIER